MAPGEDGSQSEAIYDPHGAGTPGEDQRLAGLLDGQRSLKQAIKRLAKSMKHAA
jgi:hypothetical protein